MAQTVSMGLWALELACIIQAHRNDPWEKRPESKGFTGKWEEERDRARTRTVILAPQPWSSFAPSLVWYSFSFIISTKELSNEEA